MFVKMLLAGVFSEMGAFMHHKNIKNVTQRKTPHSAYLRLSCCHCTEAEDLFL